MRRGAWVKGVLLLGMVCVSAACAHASLTVLVGEPFGSFGTMMPNGHVTLYLDRVCADGPTRLRMCREDEPRGVAIARLNAIGPIDWIASPILQFLYASEDADTLLDYATPEKLKVLQQAYRARYLAELYPDGTEKLKANDEWWETVGVAYVRKHWAYEVATTRAQDEAFVSMMNARGNVRRYRLHGVNCADFVADAVNFYFPGTVRLNKAADLDLMTPKQVARGLYEYGEAHPEAQMKLYEIPQLPGSLRRSRPVRGAAESLLKTKRYLATLLVIQPEAVAALWVIYMKGGRWNLGKGSEVETPAEMMRLVRSRPDDRLTAAGEGASPEGYTRCPDER